jgi:DNA-binding HxlR family transcriptional regulator
MARTHGKVGDAPEGTFRVYTPESAAAGVSEVLKIIEGRWKTIILFHLFDKGTLRFSQLERAIPGVSQKMLGQQLKDLETDGIVTRTVYPEVPPKVEYNLTEAGQALCPVLDSILKWSESHGPVSKEG